MSRSLASAKPQAFLPFLVLTLVALTATAKVVFNTSSSSPIQVGKPSVLLIGDSIGYGHRDCTITSCQLEENTFLSLYAFRGGANSIVNAAISETSASNVNPDTMSGQARAQAGEFDDVTNTESIIEYGRNDINRGIASDTDFYEALMDIGNSLLSPGENIVERNNNLVFMTIPPMTPTSWISAAGKRTARPEYKEQIASTEYPIEYDSIFSARIWEAAQELGADIVPVHEYFYFHPDDRYFSTDGIHPSSEGVKLLTWLFSFRGGVMQTDLNSIPLNSTISATSNAHGFGMVVSKKDGQIIKAAPIEFYENKSISFLKTDGDVTLFSSVPISILN